MSQSTVLYPSAYTVSSIKGDGGSQLIAQVSTRDALLHAGQTWRDRTTGVYHTRFTSFDSFSAIHALAEKLAGVKVSRG